MTTLAARQREFMAALVGDGPGEPGLETYRRNVFGNWHDALAAAYPVVRRLVGDAFFREAARRHALAYPSTKGDLHDYGDRFAEFLAAYPYASQLRYLPDVARLERALVECTAAADVAPFEPAALAAVPAARLGRVVLQLHPSVRRLESQHAVLALWEANQPGHDGTPLRSGPERIVVARRDGEARAQRLELSAWQLLARVAEGAPLGDAVDALDDAEREFAQLLRDWTAGGIIGSFLLSP